MQAMIQILTESVADLTPAQIAEHGIGIIPMSIHLNGSSYRDSEEITPALLFNLVETHGDFPKTSAPSIEEYKAFFSRPGEKIFIGLSSALSSAFTHASLAAQELADPDLHLIDSKSLSVGIAQLVLNAAQYRQEGLGTAEIVNHLEMDVVNGRGLILLENLEYLQHSGRVSSLQVWLSSRLKIRLLLGVSRSGTIEPHLRGVGSRQKFLDMIAHKVLGEIAPRDGQKLIVCHLERPEDAAYLAGLLQAAVPSAEVSINQVGCLLASHSGPGAIGVAYTVS